MPALKPTSSIDNDATSSREKSSDEEVTPYITSDVEILSWNDSLDKHNPRRWPQSRKWLIAGAALIGTLLIPINGTSITVAAGEINREFGVSDATFPNSYWTVTSWSIGGSIFLIFLFPIMEDVGVKAGYMVFYLLFFCMIIGQAVAQNYATLIITRAFSGGCVTLLANTISSIIPDIWATDEERSVPVGIYVLFYVMGNTLGPVVFAPVVQYLSTWRWIFYIQLIVYGALGPVIFLILRETRGDVILRRHAKHLRRTTGRKVKTKAELHAVPTHLRLAKAASRPFYLLFTEPVLFAATLWSAFSMGTVFLFTQSTAQVFTGLYGWAEYSSGYVQGAIVVGEVLGWIVSLYGTRLYLRSAQHNTETPGQPIPEARLYVSIPASFIGIAGGMFVYAWTSYPWIPWIAPAIGLAMVGFGIQIVISAAADYVVDAYAASDYAGSAISAVACVENIFAGFLPLAAQSMYTDLGYQWASSLLAFLAILLSLAPVMFVWKGRWFRSRSPFMQGHLAET